MDMKWVAPPSWPQMPPGFTPPTGWEPDSSWPEAPPGWQFWQPVAEVDTPKRPWLKSTQGMIVAGVVGIMVLLVIGIVIVATKGSHAGARTLNVQLMDSQMTKFLNNHGILDAEVECPSGEKAYAGNKFLCPVSLGEGVKYMSVTVLNSKGDLDYQATQ